MKTGAHSSITSTQSASQMDKARIGGSNRMLSMHETAEMLGMAYATLKERYKTLGIPYVRNGRRVTFRERMVLTWIEQRERANG